MDQDMVKRLRASNEYDLMAARLLDCAAVCVKKGWTQHTNARDEHGVDTDARDPSAVCWCAQGAMHAASHGVGLTEMDEWGCVTYTDADLASHVETRAHYALQFGIKSLEIVGSPSPLDTEVRAVNITGWNDRRARTKAEVLRAFGSGAEQLRLRIESVQKGIGDAHIQEIRNG